MPISYFSPNVSKRIAIFAIYDILVSFITLWLSYELRFNFNVPPHFANNIYLVFAILLVFKIISLAFFKVYFIVWRFFSLIDAMRILYAHVSSYGVVLLLLILVPNGLEPFARSIIFIDMALSIIAIGSLRISKRVYLEAKKNYSHKNAILIGIDNAILNTISTLLEKNKINPIAIFEHHSSNFVGTYIKGIKVENIQKLSSKNAHIALISKDFIGQGYMEGLQDKLINLGIENIKTISLEHDKEIIKNIKEEDLLARKPKDLDIDTISDFVKGKNIIITGGGGSIGSEIARQCAHFKAAHITLIDNSEYNLYKIAEQIPNASAKLTSILQKERLEQVIKEINADILIHAAAYKHVPLCEQNPKSAIDNNIKGSRHVIDACIKYKIKKVVLISTDKAVNPTNVMGATKRVVEMYGQNIYSKDTQITSVRFGNVLSSSGSVVPKFKEQIKNNQDITVTHKDITRYFMLIPEACLLVLQAASIGKQKEIFILDMGEPVKISTLAKTMIKLYKKEGEVNIKYTGIRPGEKLYEELLIEGSETKTKYKSIFIAKYSPYDIQELKSNIDDLLVQKDKENIIKGLKNIVKEYVPYGG